MRTKYFLLINSQSSSRQRHVINSGLRCLRRRRRHRRPGAQRGADVRSGILGRWRGRRPRGHPARAGEGPDRRAEDPGRPRAQGGFSKDIISDFGQLFGTIKG